ncbi:hypothetical protein L6164_025993 [Bauhinia variegata]|uniref:Uncharacterized protein n=1 Tax=Bauhinia variegata TaxID=167791 RepID=A0ACB9M5F6_BAUVA|nr:hypothetical protein L6164_025993 [Bauhinia variegata]
MKFPTSHSSPSSLSSSSSSTLAFDPAMCSSKSATAGCLSAILRRILCSGGLPTHPSDQIREFDSAASDRDKKFKAQKKVEDAAATVNACSNTPGIVARLMGLDSMVERETPSSSSASSLSRSRSMNSVDYLGESNSIRGLHRRVKSTLSFREVPPFVELENENFFILSFENVRESKEFRSKGKKTEMSSSGLKQKRMERQKMKEHSRENVSQEKILNEKEKLRRRVCEKSPRNVPGNVSKLREITNTVSRFRISSENKYFNSEAGKLSPSSKSIKHKEILNGEKLKSRKKKEKKKTSCSTKKKTELDCNLQESSPVSVLDFERKAHESDSCVPGLSSRRKLSAELENEQKSLLLSDGNLEKKKYDGSNSKRKENNNAQEYIEIWSEVLRLVEDDLVGSKGIEARVWKQGDSLNLSADFESEILDHLLDEFIDQLVGDPLKSL